MVVYDFCCGEGHRFEGWFNSLEDYSAQLTKGLLSCPVCGSSEIKKIPSASYVTLNRSISKIEKDMESADKVAAGKLLVEKLHDYIESNFEDVGTAFAEEARKIHKGESEERNIRGQATVQEVKELREEGVEAYHVPPKPVEKRKLN
jgi:hypothetical protein